MCAAQTIPAPLTAWQSHRQSQWRPSIVSPGRYSSSYMQIHANAMKYMQIQELIHADTNSQIDTGQIQQDTYRYMQFCML